MLAHTLFKISFGPSVIHKIAIKTRDLINHLSFRCGAFRLFFGRGKTWLSMCMGLNTVCTHSRLSILPIFSATPWYYELVIRFACWFLFVLSMLCDILCPCSVLALILSQSCMNESGQLFWIQMFTVQLCSPRFLFCFDGILFARSNKVLKTDLLYCSG